MLSTVLIIVLLALMLRRARLGAQTSLAAH
jgi:hypothetical protein